MTNRRQVNGLRTFLILWATQSLSVFGSALTSFSLTIWLTTVLYPAPEQRPQLALALSSLSLAMAIPTLISAPFAGALADRYDRRRMMMWVDAANGVLSLALMLLILGGTLRFGMLVALAMLFAVLGQLHGSAFDTCYVTLVPGQHLPRANGMMQTMWALSGVLSPAIAATLISLPSMARQGTLGAGGLAKVLSGMTNGAPLAIAIDVLTFWVAAVTMVFLRIPSPLRASPDGPPSSKSAAGAAVTIRARQSIWADVREGALYIWYRRPLLWLLGTFALVNFLSGFMNILAPLLLKFSLAPDLSARGMTFESALALYSSSFAMGGVLGGVFISSWGGLKRRRVLGVLVPLALGGVFVLTLGLSQSIHLTAAMAFLIGFQGPVTNSHSQAIWQTQTPPEMQGRVFAVRRVIAQFMQPFSMALAGVFGGVFSPGAVIAIAGAIWAVFLLAQVLNPYLRRVEDRAWLEELARAATARAQAGAAARARVKGKGKAKAKAG